MNKIALVFLIALSGCSTIQDIKQYWPKAHDPVQFGRLVDLDVGIEQQNCDTPTWAAFSVDTEKLARYAEWRNDPQAANLRGLQKHVDRMSQGGSKILCEIGKKTARQRIEAARSAWKGR